jgi:hypothetical protein
MKHSTGNRTKAEQARFDKMKEMGQCVACYQRGVHGRAYIEINHMLSGNRRIGHMATYSLCLWHHQGEPFDGMTKKSMLEKFGTSLKYPGSKPFRAEFGTDAELLAIQNALLGETDGE